ncbi:MAG: sigma-70 family RNA polymerase sigma factor, partial [Alphaproteobacteria bacterium]
MPADIDCHGKIAAQQEYFADLVHAIARWSDRQAFERLFRHYAPRLKAYGLKLGADGAAAEELAQDAMLTLWRKAASFDPAKASVSTWLFTIARNRRIDMMRRESRPLPAAEELLAMVAPAPAADARAQANDEQAQVQDMLAALPGEQRVVLRMAYFEDKSHRDIAAALGLPLGTVKSRVRLA